MDKMIALFTVGIIHRANNSVNKYIELCLLISIINIENFTLYQYIYELKFTCYFVHGFNTLK